MSIIFTELCLSRSQRQLVELAVLQLLATNEERLSQGVRDDLHHILNQCDGEGKELLHFNTYGQSGGNYES
jgi:hypothetical protein